MRGYMKEVKKKRQVAYAGTSEEGVGVIHFRKKIPLAKILAAVRSLGLRISDEKHPERRKYLDVKTGVGELVATLVDSSLLLLPKHVKTKQLSIEFANALI